MKKFILCIMVIGMIFSMFGCSNDENSKTDLSNVSNEQSKDLSNIESMSDDSSISENSNVESSVDESLPENASKVNIYVPSSSDEDLCKIIEYQYNGTIEGLINTMIKVNALPKGTKLLSFKIENEIAYIDLSKEYSDAMIGSFAELQYVIALVNTIIDCYDDTDNVSKVRYTVEGKDLDVGGGIHDVPVSFMSLS